jgi:hypothetical protein
MPSGGLKVSEIVRDQVRRTRDDREIDEEVIVRIAHRWTPKEWHVVFHGQLAEAIKQLGDLSLAQAESLLVAVEHFIVLEEQRVGDVQREAGIVQAFEQRDGNFFLPAARPAPARCPGSESKSNRPLKPAQ